MADHPVNGGVRPGSWPDWPADGEVRPQLISRLERTAKKTLKRLRRLTGPLQPVPDQFDPALVYDTLSDDRIAQNVMFKRMLRLAADPQQAIDISFAALVLAVASGDRPRAEGLAGFLSLCYLVPELDDGVARMARQLEARSDLPPSLRDLRSDLGWRAFVEDLHERFESMPAVRSTTIERRRFPAIPPRRVVVRISGGLGNQMFQYAAALGYARRTRVPLRLDLANYDGDGREREFLLGRMRVPVRRANSYEVASARLRPHRQPGSAFDDFLFQDHGSAWLSGYWEDDAYFADLLPVVKRRFLPRDGEIAAAASGLVESARVVSGPVIGVHLRRGDRRPGGTAFAPFSSLPASYFREAASRFPGDPNFLVFSDTPEDIAWCRGHLGLGETSHVTFGEGLDPILDMFALVNCEHLILSAGTFSWWAGYLGQRPGRRVIVPNVLQGQSAEWATLSARRLQPGWEEVTLPPGSVS